MRKKLLRFGWTPYVIILLIVLLVLNTVIRSMSGFAFLPSRLPFFLFVALCTLVLKLAATPLTRRLVWRVRNRLLLTYFLIGVLPITLILIMVFLSTGILLGMTVSYITKENLTHILDRLDTAAHERARSSPGGSKLTQGPITEIPSWSTPGFRGVIRDEGKFYFAAHAESGDGPKRAEVFFSEPFDDAGLSRLTSGLGASLLIQVTVRRSGDFEIRDTNDAMLDSTRADPSVRVHRLSDFGASGIVPVEVRLLGDGDKRSYVISLFSNPTTVLNHLISDLPPVLSNVVVVLLQTLGGVFVVVITIAVASSLQLTRSLTRTIHDLHRGTRQVQTGDFSQRVPIRSTDQLSDLAGSFNIMTHRMERLIVEVKEKEKMESELQIARQVQSQLFPKDIPPLKTLELIGLCNPARMVSGDYYDFIPLESGLTAVALGDISGKGISAALLMATLQSSLRAQLALNTDRVISTASLVGRLNRQLYDHTQPEKYATFYCGIYDDANGHLLYTNAGHLPPILLRGKNSSRLEATGTVVGIFPDPHYEQNELQLDLGDLLIVFTDGITEAEDRSGEQYGEERLTELLIRHRDKPLDEITRIVTDEVHNWAFDPDNQDDTTLLLARRI